MAEIRCPMCGKPNPADLDVCQFCEARLKPVTDELARSQPPLHPGEEPTEQDTGQLESGLPQWLRDVRQQARDSAQDPAEEEPEPTPEPEQVPVEEEAPQPEEPVDLLSGLRSQAEEDEEIPGWLAGLRGESEQPVSEDMPTEDDDLAALRNMLGDEAPVSQEPEASELPGWISDLGADEEPAQAEPQPTASDSDFGWNADFETESAPQTDSVEDDAPIDTDLPAWLQGDDEESKGEADVPEWAGMEDASQAAPVVDSEDTSQPIADESDTPDWLASLGEETTDISPQEEEAQPADEIELPDWIASLGEEDTEAPSQEEPVKPVAEGELPDWISSLGEEGTEITSEEEIEQPIAEDELPDWVSSSGVEGTEATYQEEPVQPATEDELPDWISSLGEESAEEPSQEPVQPAAEGELPDWVSSPAEESAEVVSQEDTIQPTTESDLPDWLTLPGEEAPEVSPEAETELPFEQIETPAAIPDEAVEERSAAPAFVDDEGEPLSTDDVDAIFSMDMPDWLSESAPEGEVPEVSADTEEDDLRPADLPDWVQAMRPVESVIAGTEGQPLEEQPVEEEGPLAGLRGVLPAVPGVGPSSKPEAYSLKLQASDDQQANASMLEQMLAEEIHPRKIISQPVMLSQRLLRLIMAVVLLLVVGVPVFSGTQISPLFSGVSPATGAFLKEYVPESLPANAPVLVIFDYDAALSGELEAVAAPLIDYMILQKAPRLALISTTPVGPGLAEQFIALENTQASIYYQDQVGQQFINLGYLPGGAAGVLAFARDPKRTKPISINGENAWETPALEGVSRLSEFAAIILLTDNVETARIWIEQTERARGEAVFLVVSSAQSGPMIQPYHQSGQVDVMLAGLDDGAPIERFNAERPGMIRRYWDAYGFGLLTAIGLIVLGSLWSLASGWQTRRKEQGEA